jgi:hydrogenase large subunit
MDPVTRIEGHMKVEVTIDSVGGRMQVTDAKCTGTLFRGFESLLQGRNPWDAPVLTQRICGVCPTSHGLASVMAIEAAAARKAPVNARVLRNLVLGADFIHSHILHFYLLSAFDYVKGLDSAPWTPAWDIDIRADASSGIVGHLGQAIEARRRAHEMGAIFGGKMPLSHAYIPGGFTAVPTGAQISLFRNHLSRLIDFIQGVYIPDAEELSSLYPDYHSIGKGHGNLLAYGVFDLNDAGSSRLLKRGLVYNSSPTQVQQVQTGSITESVTYSWYDNSTNNLKPTGGSTKAVYPKTNAYSWLKAPRYNGKPFEAGPLARMWINGDYRKGVSVMDRHLARANETLKIAEAMNDWLDQLAVGGQVYSTFTTPSSGSGEGLTEAPRGALGHWITLNGGNIGNYQIVTPTCWNASPRDSQKVRGPMEQALVGTPVSDPDQPIEVLRVIHSMDPCLSCAVHMMRPGKKPVVVNVGCK